MFTIFDYVLCKDLRIFPDRVDFWTVENINILLLHILHPGVRIQEIIHFCDEPILELLDEANAYIYNLGHAQIFSRVNLF